MSKITQVEFEKWSKFFSEFCQVYTEEEIFTSLPPEAQEKEIKMFTFLFGEIKNENTIAVFIFLKVISEIVNKLPPELQNKRSPKRDNLTPLEYLATIKQRLIEHHSARGYFNPHSPLSLEEFKQKRNQVGWGKKRKFGQDETYRNELFSEMNDEDFSFVWKFYNLIVEINKIFGDSDSDEKMTEESYQEMNFYLEDLVKTLEKAQTQLEQKKKKNQNGSSTPPQPTSNSNQRIADQLETEKTQLENQKAELENQVATSEQEKTLKDQALAQITEKLKQKDIEIKKLKEAQKPGDKDKQNNPSASEKNNSNLIKWAIGLGIAILVVGIFCLILLLRPKRRQ